ncbi:uncharacterized protein N7473_006566 [Penicillium subrubescens]|uniref:uncharacterized protein n=1 Tax=Penicillium subrubescens TaxID=1316194 RepID=UPI002544D562|nr:uncharacterized protein N7473_006566 [Penicillium subrubescens]KAJ5890338.1 hypothetical protein N7473_006566 [Penicillium subrubescens]
MQFFHTQRGAKTCLNDNDLLTARSPYYGQNGWGGTITGSNIPTQQLCWDSTLDIINQCLGHKNGGSYSQNGWNVSTDFCP